MSVKTICELESFWNQFQPDYESRLGQTMCLFNHGLIHLLDLNSASNILELGCGPGLGTLALSRRISDEQLSISITACDLSPAMINCSRKRLPSEITLKVANNMLLPFEPASFDRVMAGMNLNLVPNPETMLQEIFRVLKPGGRMGISVWGRAEKSFALTVFNKACEKIGIPVPDVRSNFYLGTKEALKPLVKNAGFKDLLAWHQPAIYSEIEAEEYAKTLYAAPNRTKIMQELENEKAKQLHQILVEMIKEKLVDEEEPLILDGLIIVANKPSN